MKYSNDDMDDLFRRAAERYPLRTDSADWNRLSGELDGEPAPPSEEGEKRRRRGAFWWFLLIPLAGIGYLTWETGVHHTSATNAQAANAQPANAQPVNAAGQPTSGVTAEPIAAGNAHPAKANSATTTPGVAHPAKANSAASNNPRPVTATTTASAANPVSATNSASAMTATAVRNRRTSVDRNPPTATTSATRTASTTATTSATRTATTTANSSTASLARGKTVPESKTPESKTFASKTFASNIPASKDPAPTLPASTTNPSHELALAALDLRRAPIGARNRIAVDVVAPQTAAPTPDDNAPPTKKPNKKPDSNSTGNKRHAYIGLSAAPDFSTVRFQKMTGVGTTFGLLLGYSFNARWAVESGLYVDRKRYYTSGEYFNTKNVRLPAYASLLSVDGTCYMWEIPVNVRYNFTINPNAKTKWFGTAGLSTYLMSREKYTYEYEYGSPGWGTGDSLWNIHKPSQYWFMIVNLGAGFEQRIGKAGNLRLEPYIRVPLAGIGTGRLSVLSAGVNIGFTRQLW